MKNKILKIAKEIGKEITVESQRLAFDMVQYIVYCGSRQDSFVYFTGKTSNGIKYPTENDNMLNSIRQFIQGAPINTPPQTK